MHSQKACMIATLILNLAHVCNSQCATGSSGPIIATLQSSSSCAAHLNGVYYCKTIYNGQCAFERSSNVFLYMRPLGWTIGDAIGSDNWFIDSFIKTNTIWDLNEMTGWFEYCSSSGITIIHASTKFSISQQCSLCSAGKYSEITGALKCTDCPAGKYSTALGAVSAAVCTDCAAGKFSAATGAETKDKCFDCAAGTYSSVSGALTAETCIKCTGNSTSTAGATGITSCQCNTGYTAVSGGACGPCVAGTFKAALGSSVCTACARGTFADSPGTSACTACAAGKYSDEEGALSEATCRTLRVLNTSEARTAVRVEADTCAAACQPPYVLLRERLRALGLWGRADVAAGAVVLETPELPNAVWGLDAERTCVRCGEDACGVGKYPAGVLCQCMECDMDEELDALPAIM
jgi:hypothetical protein